MLRNPQGLDFDPAGRLVVANPGRGRVDTFAGNAAANAQPLSVLSGTGGLQTPTGLDLDEPGDIFVSDSAANRVLEFAAGSKRSRRRPLGQHRRSRQRAWRPRPSSPSCPPTPAPRVRVSTRRRVSRKQLFANGIVLHLRVSGSLAFRGEPVLVSAVARVRGATIAAATPAPLRPGRTILRLVQARPRGPRAPPPQRERGPRDGHDPRRRGQANPSGIAIRSPD